jgi:tRNA G18 (ribose-2'-O)-methylase SpoU
VAGLDQGGETAWDRTTYPPKMALVVGGEARGLRPRVAQVCDARIAIPLAGGIESLNLSVAAAVVLYEALRQERRAGGDD